MTHCSRLLSLVYIGLVLALIPAQSLAGPTGATVNAGSATVEQNGTATIIRQTTPRADLSWQNFDINAGESVEFIQPSANAIALNRINNARPTTIEGSLTANGRVWLLNPNNIIFGNGASLDVNGLLATTSQISTADFVNSVDRFQTPGGRIEIDGIIRAAEGGILIAAPDVRNSGQLSATNGDVILVSGGAFQIAGSEGSLPTVTVNGENRDPGSLIHGGSISAENGSVFLTFAPRILVIRANPSAAATGLTEVDGRVFVTSSPATETSRVKRPGQVKDGNGAIRFAETVAIDNLVEFNPAGSDRASIGIEGSNLVIINSALDLDRTDLSLEANDYIVIESPVVVRDGDLTLRAMDAVQIGDPAPGGVLLNGPPPGAVNVTGGNVIIGGLVTDTGADQGPYFVSLLADVVAQGSADGGTILGGLLKVDSHGDIFVEATRDIRAGRVEMTANKSIVQAPLTAPILITITSDASHANPGVRLEGDAVLIAGRIVSDTDISIIANGTRNKGGSGTVKVGDFAAFEAFLSDESSFQLEGGQAAEPTVVIGVPQNGSPNAGLFADGTIDIDAATALTIDRPIAGNNVPTAAAVELEADSFSITGTLASDAARIDFLQAATIGGAPGTVLPNATMDLFQTNDLTVSSASDLSIGDIAINRPVTLGTSLTFTAGGAVNVRGIVPGTAQGANQAPVPLTVNFGEETGTRPSGATVDGDGRIGVTQSGDADPIGSLGFFVDGDVLIDPFSSAGDLILAAGPTTIDITGSFSQQNTASPGNVSDPASNPQLVNGVGGEGAVLGEVTLQNAQSLELFGEVGGFATFNAVQGVAPAAGFTVTALHQVNDCPVSGASCLPMRLVEKYDPEGPLEFLQMDLDVQFGSFEKLEIDFLTQPLTNRGNDEEWER